MMFIFCGRRESITSLRQQCQCALPWATRLWILGIGTSSGVCHPSMTFLFSLSFLPPHPTGCGRRESITPLRQQCQCALPWATRSWILVIGTSSGVCHPSMTFLPSLSFLPPHPTGCGRRESITPLRQQCQYELPWATRSWILGIGTASRVCHPSMTFLLSLSFLPPHPTGCGRRESITSLRQQCQCALPLATKSWILGIGTSSGVCHPSMTFLLSLSFLPPHPTGCGRRE